MGRYDVGVQRRLTNHAQRFVDLEGEVQHIRDIQQRFEDHIRDIRKDIGAMAKETPPQTAARRGFEDIDYCILRISSPTMVSKDSVCKVLQPWLDGVEDLKDGDYSFPGPPGLARIHIIRFRGNPAASDLCHRVHSTLRDRITGKWGQFFVTAPGGQQAQLFVSKDSSRRQRATIAMAIMLH